jgi:hypothetical protein
MDSRFRENDGGKQWSLTPLLMLAATALLLAGCDRSGRAAPPSFGLVFPPIEGDLMTTSSPSLADLSGDGVPDIVFGTGVDRVVPAPSGGRMLDSEPDVSGYVVAVSGKSNEILWQVPNPRDAFTTPRFARLNGDDVPDVVMGGREGVLSAFSGVDGALLWRVTGDAVAKTSFPLNFFTPAAIDDANGDGVSDLLVTYGGDDSALPRDPRGPGYLAVISGADGKVLAAGKTPDGAETYSSPVVYRRPDRTQWVVFGTGGETLGGAAYRAPVASLLDGTFATRAERLVEPGKKGVIAPATLADLTGDGELDIIVSTFGGRLVAVDGASGKALWQNAGEGEETYQPAAVVRIAPDGRLGLFVSRGIGAFPKYVGSVHRLLSADDGRVIYEHRDALYPGGAPLAIDLDADGVDEPIFFTVRFPTGHGGRIYILDVASDSVIAHDVPTNLWTTPVIADPRGKGTLELIGLAWSLRTDARSPAGASSPGGFDVLGDPGSGAPTWRDLRWQLLRLNLGGRTPDSRSWAAYMGTAADGQYTPRAAGDHAR